MPKGGILILPALFVRQRRLPVSRGGDHVLLHFTEKGAAHKGQDGECRGGGRRWKGGRRDRGRRHGDAPVGRGTVDGRTSKLALFRTGDVKRGAFACFDSMRLCCHATERRARQGQLFPLIADVINSVACL